MTLPIKKIKGCYYCKLKLAKRLNKYRTTSKINVSTILNTHSFY